MEFSKQNAQLIIVEPVNRVKRIAFVRDQIKIGSACTEPGDIQINSRIVSREHGVFTKFKNKYYYMDFTNTNGTFINNKFVDKRGMDVSPAIELNDGDVISIGSSVENGKVYIIFSNTDPNTTDWKVMNLQTNPLVKIGRGLDNNIIIRSVNVSRNHAVINFDGYNVNITDLKSSNGTIINGRVLSTTTCINDGDVVNVGPSKIIRVSNALLYCLPSSAQNNYGNVSSGGGSVSVPPEVPPAHITPAGGVEVRVENISKIVACKKGTGPNGASKKAILSNVSLKINAGELVAILGGSGAGKTTFMNCINGFEPATSGRVYVNGNELYSNYPALKSSIGYVPQQDIVYDNLTLEEMLRYTGKLRLPADVSKEELDALIVEVMKMVDLYPQKDTFIKKMSGGQRKRASIAVELVSDPSLFFLDEPTSGLDPEAETNLMHRLRALSNEKGKTVIVITHTLQNINLFDKLIFLAPGGKLCFYGSPAEAMEFFEVDNLTNAYEKISADIDGYVAKYQSLVSKEAL